MVSGCLNKGGGLTLIYKKWNRWTLRIFCFVPKLSVEKRWSGKKQIPIIFLKQLGVCLSFRSKFLRWNLQNGRHGGRSFYFVLAVIRLVVLFWYRNVPYLEKCDFWYKPFNDYIILRVDFVWSKLLSYSYLGGGFKYFWNVHPETWGKWSNLTCAYFSDGLVKNHQLD